MVPLQSWAWMVPLQFWAWMVPLESWAWMVPLQGQTALVEKKEHEAGEEWAVRRDWEQELKVLFGLQQEWHLQQTQPLQHVQHVQPLQRVQLWAAPGQILVHYCRPHQLQPESVNRNIKLHFFCNEMEIYLNDL